MGCTTPGNYCKSLCKSVLLVPVLVCGDMLHLVSTNNAGLCGRPDSFPFGYDMQLVPLHRIGCWVQRNVGRVTNSIQCFSNALAFAATRKVYSSFSSKQQHNIALSQQQSTTMEALLQLPDRGVFGVVPGWRALQQAPPATYICCHNTEPPEDQVVRNAAQKLSDLYKGAQRRHAAQLAAKRAARQQPPDSSRLAKRHQQGPPAAQDAEAKGTAAAVGGGGGGCLLDDVLQNLSPNNLPAAKPAPAAAAKPKQQASPFHSAPGTSSHQQQQQNQAPLGLAPAAAAPAAGRPGTAAASNHSAAEPGAGAGNISGSSSGRQAVFSHEQLRAKTNKELVELLKGRSCPVSGKKEELIRRLMDYQFRLRKAAQGSGGAGSGGTMRV